MRLLKPYSLTVWGPHPVVFKGSVSTSQRPDVPWSEALKEVLGSSQRKGHPVPCASTSILRDQRDVLPCLETPESHAIGFHAPCPA